MEEERSVNDCIFKKGVALRADCALPFCIALILAVAVWV